ncbi:MAG: YhcH/YjgK/YiaL family protein [Verrucomicrobiales bacterium]|nr:YhcH/YjgK/YiaL family protein [Verrucomicrobiales bacterium]
MLYGHLSDTEAYAPLLSNEAWRFAFDWLRRLPPDPEPGIRELRGPDLYVNIHGYETLPVAECRYESHRKYVDLQYCIRGGETIDWQRTVHLVPDGPFQMAKDVQFYLPAESHATLRMTDGNYAIFFPTDGHRPKQSDGRHPTVFKLVIKVAHSLLL